MNRKRFVRLVAKNVQGFHVRTRTDKSLSELKLKSLVSQIDYRKPLFLGTLCNMSSQCEWYLYGLLILTVVCGFKTIENGP